MNSFYTGVHFAGLLARTRNISISLVHYVLLSAENMIFLSAYFNGYKIKKSLSIIKSTIHAKEVINS